MTNPTPARGAVDFDELFEDSYPGLHRYCTRLTADSDLAADVAQEAFVRLLERKVSGTREGVRAWLFKVATHLVRDRARVRSNRERLLEANPMEGSSVPSIDDEIDREARIAAVRRALDGLDERDRTLLLMKEEGFAYREIAEVIDVEASSIGTLLARARKRFASALESEGGLTTVGTPDETNES